MFRKLIDIIIFLFIFSLYFVSSLMIYDRFRERKLTDYERDIIDKFDEEVKVEENKEETKEKTKNNT